MSKIFSLDWVNVQGAIIHLLMAGVVAVAIYIVSVGSVFLLEWKMVLDVFILAAISAFLASLGKSYVTDSEGKIGGVQVK